MKIIYLLLLVILTSNFYNAQCSAIPNDCDGDGILNAADFDDDNDGILDTNEGCGNIVTPENGGTFGTTAVNRNLSLSPGGGYIFRSGQLNGDGDYAIISNSSPQPHADPALWNFNGHTANTPDDAYLAVNGYTQIGVFFAQKVKLVAGVSYTYSFWHAAARLTFPAQGYDIRISVFNENSNTPIASTTSGIQTTIAWKQTTLNFTPTVTGFYDIKLQNERQNFNGNDFAIDDISFISPCGTTDTDADGIPDHLDLDSDNDGCFDAIEGGDNVLQSQIDGQGRILGSVDTNGIKQMVNPGGAADLNNTTGQSVGNSINSAINECSGDSDGDGILDSSDLDDDNDGIFDVDESLCNGQFDAGWFSNSPGGTFNQDGVWPDAPAGGLSYGGAHNNAVVQSANPFSWGSGLTPTQTGTSWALTNVESTSFQNAKAGNDYVQYSFTTPASMTPGTVLRKFGFGNTNINSNYKISVEISSDGFASGSNTKVVVRDFEIIVNNTGYNYLSLPPNKITPRFILPNTTYTFRVYIYGTSSSASIAQYDDFQFGTCVPLNKDTDGDGIPDHLDLDSDGDGCFDSIEGGGNVEQNQVNAQGRILGSVDSEGVPVLVNLYGLADLDNNQGQSVNNSANAAINDCRDTDGDGIADINDLDDDNDGITDSDECGPALNTLETGGSFAQTSGFRDFAIAPNPPLNGYTYGSAGTINNPGQYVITSANNSRNIHSFHWKNLFGHTTGDANDAYIAVNGSTSVATFYRQDLVPLQPNTLYRVSLWAINAVVTQSIYDDSPANLRIRIFRISDNAVVADYSTGDMYAHVAPAGTLLRPLHWREAAGTFNSGNETSFRIEVSNISTSSFDNDFAIDDITIRQAACADSDNDGVLNSLELDSDNDGCPDAVEGTGNIVYPNLNPNTSISGQVSTGGIPLQVPGGQGVGGSNNASVNGCICYKPGVTTGGSILNTNHGITSLGRAGKESNWPMVRKGAWTVLESKTKGFVPNRLTQVQVDAIPSANLVEGMMVYNISLDCLQLYIGGISPGWKCLSNTQSCPDVN